MTDDTLRQGKDLERGVLRLDTRVLGTVDKEEADAKFEGPDDEGAGGDRDADGSPAPIPPGR